MILIIRNYHKLTFTKLHNKHILHTSACTCNSEINKRTSTITGALSPNFLRNLLQVSFNNFTVDLLPLGSNQERMHTRTRRLPVSFLSTNRSIGWWQRRHMAGDVVKTRKLQPPASLEDVQLINLHAQRRLFLSPTTGPKHDGLAACLAPSGKSQAHTNAHTVREREREKGKLGLKWITCRTIVVDVHLKSRVPSFLSALATSANGKVLIREMKQKKNRRGISRLRCSKRCLKPWPGSFGRRPNYFTSKRTNERGSCVKKMASIHSQHSRIITALNRHHS